MTDVTVLLDALATGDQSAHAKLIEALYPELRRLANYQMKGERAGHTLQPTALVNEVYLKLIQRDANWKNRQHFFRAAAEAMRRLLVDHARKKIAEKRGGDQQRVTFSDLEIAAADDFDLLELDEALNALNERDSRSADVVKLKYFAGLQNEEIAEALNTSLATVKRDWVFARAWLFKQMAGEDPQ